MAQPQAQQPRQFKEVCSFNIPKRDMQAYRITNAWCGTCGERGWDKCPRCRKVEQDRIARLEATPGGKEVGQGSALE